MVHELRHRDGIMALSLVAELEDGMIVGHIICSNAVVKKDSQSLLVLNFGPLSVLPEYQRIGVGGALAVQGKCVLYCVSHEEIVAIDKDYWGDFFDNLDCELVSMRSDRWI